MKKYAYAPHSRATRSWDHSGHAARRFAPAGLDFVPVAGGPANLVFGVVRRAIKNGPEHNVPDTVLRRLRPGQTNNSVDWAPGCYRSDVLLPPAAPDALYTPKALCERYEADAFDALKDLVVMLTLRFPDADRLHTIWEEVRAFAYEHFCLQRSLAVIAAMHLPSARGSTNTPHVHLMIPARKLQSWGFSDCIRPRASEQGKAIVHEELVQWVEAFGPHSVLAGIAGGN